MTDDKKFPHPFDTPVTTEREVDMYQMVIDEKTKTPKLKVVKNKIQETVVYHNAPEQSFSCEKGKHNYVMIDTKKYIAKCTNCTKHWRMNPQYHKILEGHIRHRTHNYIID